MKIDTIRIYAEVLEQGLDFKNYILQAGCDTNCINIYTKKGRSEISLNDSLVDRIRKCKDVDVLLTAISNNNEFPLLMIEYSTAVPTDDHKMQRADLYYWSAIFKVPVLKIYPSNKGMTQDFGGGNKFNDEIESVLAYKNGGLFYPIRWEGLENLQTKENSLSCIYYNEQITSTIKNIILTFTQNHSFNDYFVNLRKLYAAEQSKILEKYNDNNLYSIITNSTRFQWKSQNLISKINRFGHAMDPDRGVLYFTNMLVGVENCITEIQINRPDNFNARCGYKSLIDGTPHKEQLESYIKNIIKTKQNIFDAENAIFVLINAMNIESFNIFEKISNTHYAISDKNLKNFLLNCHSMTAKCIFFLSTKLILTNQNREIICEITWNKEPINSYINSLKTDNYTPIKIEPLSMKTAKEDIITFSSVELYKKIKCELLAVSYPGAQGDRCILTGNGRTILRDYIDIIACKINNSKVTVFLEECKDNICKSTSDVKKLKNIISSTEKMNGLLNLAKKTKGIKKIDATKIAIGAKLSNNPPLLNVDYIFMFNIDNNVSNKTVIQYTVAVIDTTLLQTFKSLLNSSGKLTGYIELEQIYIIQ